MKNTILFLSHGDVADALSNSGSSQSLYSMLKNHYNVIPIDTSLRGWERWFNIIRSFHTKRERWKSRLDIGVRSFRCRSKNVTTRCVGLEGHIQAVFQFGVLSEPPFRNTRLPWFIYTDYTNMLARREYTDWAPFASQKEAQEWFEAERDVYTRSAIVFAFSENTRRSIINDYEQPEGKVVSVGAGVHYDEEDKDLKKDYYRQQVLFVGRDFERKGGHVLLEAFKCVKAKCPEAILKVVGPKEHIKGEGVVWVGPVSDREQLRRIFFDATVFAMPSIGEPFGYVFLEAMHNKTPCIGTDRGAMPEIICDGRTGYIVPAGDDVLLAERMVELLRDPQKCRIFGEAGRKRALENFTWEIVGTRIISHMDQVMETDHV